MTGSKYPKTVKRKLPPKKASAKAKPAASALHGSHTKLTDHQQVFVVERLAQYHTPQEVVALVKEEFGVELSRQQVRSYNPEQAPVAEKWRAIFERARAAFLKVPAAVAPQPSAALRPPNPAETVHLAELLQIFGPQEAPSPAPAEVDSWGADFETAARVDDPPVAPAIRGPLPPFEPVATESNRRLGRWIGLGIGVIAFLLMLAATRGCA